MGQPVNWVWIALAAVWAAGALMSKRAIRRESGGSRRLHILVMMAAGLLLYDSNLPIGVLNFRFVPDTAAVRWIGFALAAAGAGFAIWARLLLGGNWSASVTVKQDHTLIRRGPYRIVRHPIYTGLLLTVLGTAVAFGEIRGLAATAIALAGWRAKSLTEERFMREQFGDEYKRYQGQVRALIPYIL